MLVWSGWLRISHACIALSSLVLLATGWLVAESPSLAASSMDIHYIAAGFLTFGLVVRMVLMAAGREHERVVSLFPSSAELSAMAGILRCYIALGRSPLPGWYAQNPLWKPVYLIVYIALIILTISGIAMTDISLVMGFYLPSVHAFWAQLVFWFSVLHIVSVLVHDYKNQTTDISAMVNGYRLFIIDSGRDGTGAADSVQIISLDSLRRHD